MSFDKMIPPYCKRLEVVLSSSGFFALPGVLYEFSYESFSISVELCGAEKIVIASDAQVDAFSLWEVFLKVHMMQSFGMGYFYRIERAVFSDSSTASNDELETYAESCIDLMAIFYNPAKDFRDDNLSLFDSQSLGELFRNDVFVKFDAMYNEVLILFHGFWMQSADTNMQVDIRCAGIIQCYEHFGKYIAKRLKKEDELKGKNGSYLSNCMKLLLENYPLPGLFKNSCDKDSMDRFTKKASCSRNRIMHFDIYMKERKYFSGVECAGYARILHVYFRYVVLRLIGIDRSDSANVRIRVRQKWMEQRIKEEATHE